jgi:hypothetical protein
MKILYFDILMNTWLINLWTWLWIQLKYEWYDTNLLKMLLIMNLNDKTYGLDLLIGLVKCPVINLNVKIIKLFWHIKIREEMPYFHFDFFNDILLIKGFTLTSNIGK